MFLLIKDKLYKFLKLIETERAEWPGIHFKASSFIDRFLQPARKTKHRRRRVSRGHWLARSLLDAAFLAMLFRCSSGVRKTSRIGAPCKAQKCLQNRATKVSPSYNTSFLKEFKCLMSNSLYLGLVTHSRNAQTHDLHRGDWLYDIIETSFRKRKSIVVGAFKSKRCETRQCAQPHSPSDQRWS
jgi:hypothetical protein